MRIVLVRHGRPKLEAPPRIASRELADWVCRYDAAGVDPRLPPPRRVADLALSVGCVVSSDLPRAVESARLLAPEREKVAERRFREAALPRLPDAPLQLDPQLWGVLARIGWLLGWSSGSESLRRARLRAAEAAGRLAELSERHRSVLLVGHGMFNALLAWELRSRGWRGPRWPTGRYWSCAVYQRRASGRGEG